MIFSIYGTDLYQVSQKLKELKASFIQKRDKAGLNVVNLDGDSLNINQLQQESLMTPFLGEKKMIVVKNLISNKKISKEVTAFLNKNAKIIENVLCFSDFIDPTKNKVNKQNKLTPTGDLFKYLSQLDYVWEFNLIKGRELEKWIRKYSDASNIKLEPTAIVELAIRVGGDLFQITSELHKLSAFKNGEIIILDDIKKMVNSKFDDNIFGLVDALGNCDKKNALKLITNQLNFGTHPIMLLTMIARQFKLILKVKSNDANATILKLHPFVFSKAKNQSQNFTDSQIIKINNDILEIEKEFKSGEKNPELLLDLFIAKNC